MNVCYAPQPIPSFEGEMPIFLVGPPREAGVRTWRPDALRILEWLGYATGLENHLQEKHND